jgi:hypothetical protein
MAGVFVMSSVPAAASMPFVPSRDRLGTRRGVLVMAMIVHVRPLVVPMVAG